MNQQEIFDRVLSSIRGQDYRKSFRDNGSAKPTCVYIDEKGDRCAIGHLLPESVIDDMRTVNLSYNSATISQIKRFYPEVNELFKDIPTIFLVDLMDCHDGMAEYPGAERTEFERNMKAVALRYGLIYTEPTK